MDNNEQDYNGINNDSTENKISLEKNDNQNEQYSYEYGSADSQENLSYQSIPDAESKNIDEKAHNKAIASLVLGIASIVLSCCCGGVITLICGILGIIFWYNAKDSQGNREGMANAGMICSIIGIVISIIVIIVIIAAGVYRNLNNIL